MSHRPHRRRALDRVLLPERLGDRQGTSRLRRHPSRSRRLTRASALTRTFLWNSGEHRCLFTGDTVFFPQGEWRALLLRSDAPPPLDGASDRERYLESLELSRGLEFDLLLPSLATAGRPFYEFVGRGRSRASYRSDHRARAPRRERLITEAAAWWQNHRCSTRRFAGCRGGEQTGPTISVIWLALLRRLPSRCTCSSCAARSLAE
jgi:hypothetical protein